MIQNLDLKAGVQRSVWSSDECCWLRVFCIRRQCDTETFGSFSLSLCMMTSVVIIQRCKFENISYLPFLIVSLPSKGPRTGSSVSSKFSIRTTSPAASALSMASRYLSRQNNRNSSVHHLVQKMTMCTFHCKDSYPLCPMRMTRRSSPYLFLIHLMPCSWGSTMRGQRWQEVRMVAFSVDILSAGSPSFCHAAMSASSVSMVRGSRSGVTGMGTLRVTAVKYESCVPLL